MSENESKTVEFKFFAKLYELPIVKSAVVAANDRYTGLKNANFVFRYALITAEKTVDLVTITSKPVVNAFSNTLTLADTIAVQGLEKIVNNYPVAKETPEELYNDGWKKVEEIKQVGVGKVTELKEYGQKRLDQVLSTTYGTAVVNSLNSAIDLTENAINHYLPPSEGEQQRKIEGNVFQKVSALSDITRRRLYQQALVQVHKIESARDATLAPVISYANQLKEYGYQKAAAGIDEAKKNAAWLWEEVNKVETESKGVLVSVARGVTHQAINVYEQALKATDRLPEGVKKAYNDGVTYSKDVYNQLAKADNLKDASLIVVGQVYTGVQSATQYTIDTLASYIPQLQKYKSKTE